MRFPRPYTVLLTGNAICGAMILGACQAQPIAPASAATLTATAPRPAAVVSTSLCGDDYVQSFLPSAVKALSWQSRSALSRATDTQKELPQIMASPERLLSYQKALIVFGAGESAGLKTRFPHQVDLSWGEDFKSVSKNARLILSAFSAPETFSENSAEISSAKRALREWEMRLDQIREKTETVISSRPKPQILYLSRAGGSAGKNTYIDSVINVAGGVNINPVMGWHSPNIETLLSYQPDIILTSFSGGHYHSRSDISNPVLKRYIASKTRIDIDGSLWPCAGPSMIEAAEQLQDAIKTWQAKERAKEQAKAPKQRQDDA